MSAMLQLLAALWGVTLFFGGLCWIIALIAVIFIGTDALAQPFIWLFLIWVPATLALLQYLMAKVNAKKERSN